jgi:DNA topoisomerase-2
MNNVNEHIDNNTIGMFFEVEQKTDKQHILDNPDTYIGSVETVDTNMWIMDDTINRIVEKPISYIPGLFKLFDEGIVNCRDHVVRMHSKIQAGVENSMPVTYIEVEILDNGTIVMTNDGNGIDVARHPETNVWIPELIFSHLRTSTNYNKEEKKIVGGKNGFGFKLVLIWSEFGSVETVDHIRGLKYVQEFQQNLSVICPPKITKATKSKPYTKITFKPDYARLGISGLTPDIVALLKKRVYDISAVTDKTIKVKYNSIIVPTKNFEQYINLYIGDKTVASRVYEESNERWEYAVALTPNSEFIQVSFVNGIYTSKGGKHVEYILNQITRKLTEFIEKKKKIKVNSNAIKEQIILFLRCDIENPSFDSQTKDFMNTPMAKFGSRCEVSDKFIEKIAKMGVMDAACAITELKETTKASKKTGGIKKKNIIGIPKLNDANLAGTSRSNECSIIFCEGDSAKTGVMSGLSAQDKDTIGVYPLKGKVMNVRGEQQSKINDNKEIADIKQILGLEDGKEYQSIEDVHKYLRYSKVIFMTDQDLDGSHIKGLCINLFHNEYPSLTRIPGFIGFMNTPILKAKKGNQELEFYNEGEYEQWKQNSNFTNGWKIKYYKGLGTSTKSEFIEYFEKKKFVGFEHTGVSSDDAIDMVFNKKRADDRKNWLINNYDRNSFADTSKQMISYEEFIHKELIHFSKYDCSRNIPNLMDGLKTSLRKILFCAFKKNLTSEIKVAQFTGYVSEHSLYHHGEESLNNAIIGMAQNFIGSNNINLLAPMGQFGSRIRGGKDSSSPRYIFTQLEKITRRIFPQLDDYILNYLTDDGIQVEPQFYVPIIPMVLVNGSVGIGTGTSTDIMCYNPSVIIAYLKHKLQNEPTDAIEFLPYYNGFTGEVIKLSNTKIMFKGRYEELDEDTIRVTELPVGYWTDNFSLLLSTMREEKKDADGKKIPSIIKELRENYTDSTIEAVITFIPGKLTELKSTTDENGCNGLEKLLKLYSINSTTNMHMYDAYDKLKKYDKVEDIIDDYFGVRLEHYSLRKQNRIQVIEKEIIILSNKARYISEILEGTIDLRKKKKIEITQMLKEKSYDLINGDEFEFRYLVQMPMDSVSEENVAKILRENEDKHIELERIRSTTIEQMWLNELDELEVEYKHYLVEREKAMIGESKKKTKTTTIKVNKTAKKVKRLDINPEIV